MSSGFSTTKQIVCCMCHHVHHVLLFQKKKNRFEWSCNRCKHGGWRSMKEAFNHSMISQVTPYLLHNLTTISQCEDDCNVQHNALLLCSHDPFYWSSCVLYPTFPASFPQGHTFHHVPPFQKKKKKQIKVNWKKIHVKIYKYF